MNIRTVLSCVAVSSASMALLISAAAPAGAASTLPVGLDRIDQRSATLNGTYAATLTGEGVNVYVVDTGVWTAHEQFEGRASVGFDAFPTITTAPREDCHGHGTHVAGTIAGKDYGVAKKAKIISVRIGNCQGEIKMHSSGKWSIVAGLDWIVANVKRPAVVNISYGVSPALNRDEYDAAIQRVLAADIPVVVAAGNYSADACTANIAKVPQAITVGATDASNDRRLNVSNYGQCIDLFAPGVNIRSAYTSTTGNLAANTTMTGTSMAAPHVTGVAALYLQKYPTATKTAVRNAIIAQATNGTVREPDGGVMRTSPSSLLYSGIN
jgi:subtilisin family serine protease